MTIREHLIAAVARMRLEERRLTARRKAVSEKLTPEEWREAEGRALDAYDAWLRSGGDS